MQLRVPLVAVEVHGQGAADAEDGARGAQRGRRAAVEGGHVARHGRRQVHEQEAAGAAGGRERGWRWHLVAGCVCGSQPSCMVLSIQGSRGDCALRVGSSALRAARRRPQGTRKIPQRVCSLS